MCTEGKLPLGRHSEVDFHLSDLKGTNTEEARMAEEPRTAKPIISQAAENKPPNIHHYWMILQHLPHKSEFLPRRRERFCPFSVQVSCGLLLHSLRPGRDILWRKRTPFGIPLSLAWARAGASMFCRSGPVEGPIVRNAY